MTAPAPRLPADELGPPCGCSHPRGLHHPAGRCTVALPEFLADELPAWNCPCRGFTLSPPGPWRWHHRTLSWALAP